MKSYPNKLISVKDSILMSMLAIVKEIPMSGISCNKLLEVSAYNMDIEEFVDAMTNLYAISYISIDDNEIIRRVC